MAQEGDLQNIAIGFALFTICAVSLFVVVMEFSDTYDKDYSKVLDPMNVTGFNQTARSLQKDGKSIDEGFGGTESEEGETGFGKFIGFVGGEIFSTARRIITLIVAPFSLMGGVLIYIGVPPWVVNSILGILAIVFALAVWRLMKIGS